MAVAKRRTKTPTNLSLRSDLVRRAKQLGLNLSEVVDTALARAIAEAEGKTWLEENRSAIDEYNALVAERGLFSDGRRRF
jgi:antitoxin CcdA